MIYYKRVQRLGKKYKFDTEYVTDEILQLDKSEHCFNPKCKCHKQRNTENIQPKQIQQNIYADVYTT